MFRKIWIGMGIGAATMLSAPAAFADTPFRDCSDCPEMVTIQPGSFMMGSSQEEQAWARTQTKESDRDWYTNETRPHQITIAKPFALGRYDVTRGEFMAFVKETGFPLGDCIKVQPAWTRTDREPMVCVSWQDAKAYAQWMSKKTGKTYRLPTAAEWEYAARAGTTTPFYWGQAVGSGNAVCDGCGTAWDNKQPAPVGSLPPNPLGLYDMAGNVWQWTQDCYDESYKATPTDGSAAIGMDSCYRVARGGSWNIRPGGVRSAARGWLDPTGRFDYLGFRLARTSP